MARNPRVFIRNRVYDICFSTESGLPLVATAFMRVILEGILGHAARHHPVVICHFVVMANHIHILVKVVDPESVPKFVAYVKRESAAAINRLLGRAQRTVWKPGYDAPLVLDTRKVIERIVYYYLNPTKAGLESTISAYPQLSSWEAFCAGGQSITVKRIRRDSIVALAEGSLSLEDQERYAEKLLEEAEEEAELRIEPDGWIDAVLDPQNVAIVREEILKRVQAGEEYYARTRTVPVLGAIVLRLQDIRAGYEPERRGRMTQCLCSFKEVRKQTILWFKDYFDRWRSDKAALGRLEYLHHLPPGLFSPGGMLRSNLVPQSLPF